MTPLTPIIANGKIETVADNHYQLTIEAGEAGAYRLAQLEDYAELKRNQFSIHPPCQISLQMRVSTANAQGTWGMALWNDPFSFSLGLGGGTRRLPALPNAAWFFFGSPPNHLSFQDHLPGNGMLAGVFRSPKIPTWIFAPAALGLPLLSFKPFAKLARRMARLFIQEDSKQLTQDWTTWHDFTLAWSTEGCTFWLDGIKVFHTPLSPKEPLGLVLWVDNQFAAFPPNGKLAFGTLANTATTLEIKNLEIN